MIEYEMYLLLNLYLVELVSIFPIDWHSKLKILNFKNFLQILMMLPLIKNAKICKKFKISKSF